MRPRRPGPAVATALATFGSPEERDITGFAYQLGPERGPFKIDSEYLDVLVRNGKVIALELIQG